jgi:hypothetical protein
VAEFVLERLCVVATIKVAVVLTPVTPATGESVEYLTRIGLTAEYGLTALIVERFAVASNLRNTSLAKVLLCKDVDSDLAPVPRNLDVARLKYERAIGVADL